LRQDAAEQGRTLTDILLQALVTQWEHPQAAADLSETQAQLASVERKYAALERKSARLTEQRRKKAAADKKERARLAEERASADEHVRVMHETLAVFMAANPELAEENARRQQKAYEEAVARASERLYNVYARMRALLDGREDTTSVPVKELIKLCHPDKWSQGQPATELAHELMVLLNR
jgi:chromosome segregation ATPase